MPGMPMHASLPCGLSSTSGWQVLLELCLRMLWSSIGSYNKQPNDPAGTQGVLQRKPVMRTEMDSVDFRWTSF